MKTHYVFLFAIVVSVVCALFFWPTDEKKITKNLQSLSTYCSSADNESIIETSHKVASATKLFQYPLIVKMRSNNIDLSLNRKETSDRILMIKKQLPNTTFIFDDTIVNSNKDHSADVTSTLRLVTKTADNEFTDAYEIRGSVKKIDGKWLFSSFVVEDFIKK